jgi:cullin 3
VADPAKKSERLEGYVYFIILVGRQLMMSLQIGQIGADEPNFDVIWSTLAASFQQIHQKQASTLSYEELYRAAYQLVLKKKGERLYESVDQFEKNYLTLHVQSQVKALISDSLTQLNSASGSTYGATVLERRDAGESFLKGLRSQWTEHCVCLNMISDVTMYLVSLHLSLNFGRLLTF